MRYLFGDSTESDLEVDYLAFTREVIDCAVVMLECEVTLGVTVEDRRARELETASAVTAVEELGKRVSQLVVPVGKDQAATPVGRCAAAIAAAIRDAVDKESMHARAALAAEFDELDRQDQRQRERARDVLEKLMRTHDLPGAEKQVEVAWTPAGVKATMRQRTDLGIEAVLSLDIPASSIFGIDLRVDRIAENVEVHATETGGWLKKSDKLVAQKLGRYHVTNVLVGSEATTVRLRVSPEATAAGFVITARRNGDLGIEPTGGGPNREVAVDDRGRPALRLLVERLEAAVRALTETRTGLVSVEIDGKPFAQHAHPQLLAERLIAAIAPTVQKIAEHSRSPGELVLRRLIGENRREEIFVSTADLAKRFEGLPSHVRAVFAPLPFSGEPARPPVEGPKPLARPAVEVKPAPAPAPAPADRSGPVAERKVEPEPEPRPILRPLASRTTPPPVGEPESEPRPIPRPVASRTAPPPLVMPDMRSGASRLSATIPAAPAAEVRRVPSPTPHRSVPPPADPSAFFEDPDEDPEPSLSAKGYDITLIATKSHPALETDHNRADDLALNEAIERALDDEDGITSPK